LASYKRGVWYKTPYGKKTKGRKSVLETKIEEQLKEAEVEYSYESKRYRYLSQHMYIPDFILSNGIVLEVKGWFTQEDRAKLRKIKEFYPDLDLRLVFAKDNKINSRSNMRYSDWCKKWGFKYCIKEVPKEWLEEPPKPLPDTLKLREINEILKEFRESTKPKKKKRSD